MSRELHELERLWAECSLSELRSTYSSLNKDAYPEREQALRELIAERCKPRAPEVTKAAQPDNPQPQERKFVLSFIALMLGFGLLMAPFILSTEVAAGYGTEYQIIVLASSLVSGIAAFGIWRHERWGAYLYVLGAAVAQPVTYFNGWWIAESLIFPGVVSIVLLLNLRSMN